MFFLEEKRIGQIKKFFCNKGWLWGKYFCVFLTIMILVSPYMSYTVNIKWNRRKNIIIKTYKAYKFFYTSYYK